MKLIALKCPHCGGDIELNDSMSHGFCIHCGSKIMVEREAAENRGPSQSNDFIPDFYLLVHKEGNLWRFNLSGKVDVLINYRKSAMMSDVRPLGLSVTCCGKQLIKEDSCKRDTPKGSLSIDYSNSGFIIDCDFEEVFINGNCQNRNRSTITYGDILRIGPVSFSLMPSN